MRKINKIVLSLIIVVTLIATIFSFSVSAVYIDSDSYVTISGFPFRQSIIQPECIINGNEFDLSKVYYSSTYKVYIRQALIYTTIAHDTAGLYVCVVYSPEKNFTVDFHKETKNADTQNEYVEVTTTSSANTFGCSLYRLNSVNENNTNFWLFGEMRVPKDNIFTLECGGPKFSCVNTIFEIKNYGSLNLTVNNERPIIEVDGRLKQEHIQFYVAETETDILFSINNRFNAVDGQITMTGSNGYKQDIPLLTKQLNTRDLYYSDYERICKGFDTPDKDGYIDGTYYVNTSYHPTAKDFACEFYDKIYRAISLQYGFGAFAYCDTNYFKNAVKGCGSGSLAFNDYNNLLANAMNKLFQQSDAQIVQELEPRDFNTSFANTVRTLDFHYSEIFNIKQGSYNYKFPKKYLTYNADTYTFTLTVSSPYYEGEGVQQKTLYDTFSYTCDLTFVIGNTKSAEIPDDKIFPNDDDSSIPTGDNTYTPDFPNGPDFNKDYIPPLKYMFNAFQDESYQPYNGLFSDLYKAIYSRFPIIEDCYRLTSDFIGYCNNSSSSPPNLSVIINGKKVDILSFDYAQGLISLFKGIVVAFAYIRYCKSLYKRIPKII